MWDLDTIRSINNDAGKRSRDLGVSPCRVESPEEVASWPPFPFPHMGSACTDVDKESERLDTLFVDSSGFGAEDEPALTIRGFKERLSDLCRQHGPLMCAIEDQGPFQVHVAVWRADGV